MGIRTGSMSISNSHYMQNEVIRLHWSCQHKEVKDTYLPSMQNLRCIYHPIPAIEIMKPMSIAVFSPTGKGEDTIPPPVKQSELYLLCRMGFIPSEFPSPLSG